MKRAIKYIMRHNASYCLLGTRFSFSAGGEGGVGRGQGGFLRITWFSGRTEEYQSSLTEY